MATQSVAKKEASKTLLVQQHPPLINLGKVKRKHTKKLKQGRGLIMGEVQQAIQQVKASVEGEVDHHPIVISYEAKPRKKKKSFNMLGLKINRKKLKKRMKKSGLRHSLL